MTTLDEPSELSDNVGHVLGEEPKFAFEPALKHSEFVLLVRSAADHVRDDDRSRCISEGMTCLRRQHGRRERTVNLKTFKNISSSRRDRRF